jgi:hypothetical protein
VLYLTRKKSKLNQKWNADKNESISQLKFKSKSIEKVNKTKSQFSEKINKINNPPSRLLRINTEDKN